LSDSAEWLQTPPEESPFLPQGTPVGTPPTALDIVAAFPAASPAVAPSGAGGGGSGGEVREKEKRAGAAPSVPRPLAALRPVSAPIPVPQVALSSPYLGLYPGPHPGPI